MCVALCSAFSVLTSSLCSPSCFACFSCSAYNTSASLASSPTVYFPNSPSSNVTVTTPSGSSSSNVNTTDATGEAAGVSPPLTDDATLALRMLPHVAAMSFFREASDLRSLCTMFVVANSLVTASSGSNSGAGIAAPGDAAARSVTLSDYRADGWMFALLALGSLGMLLLVQLALFLVMIGGKEAALRIQALFGLGPRSKQQLQQQQLRFADNKL